MPSVVEESKGRAKLLDTLDQTGAHFIAVESGSESSSLSSSCCSSGYRDDQEDGEVDREILADATTGGRARAKEGADRRAKGRLDRARRRRDGVPSDEELLEAQGEVGGGGGGGDGSSMSMRYSRVASDRGGSSPASEAESSKRRRSQLAERISNKLHALFWVVVGAMVAYHTDFVRVLVEDERVDRFWFNIGVVCFSINVVILAYLTVWLPHVRGVKVSWNVYSPRAIPTATVVGLICALTLNVSLWDVWGFLTPLILFAVFIGCLFTLHFVPWPC